MNIGNTVPNKTEFLYAWVSILVEWREDSKQMSKHMIFKVTTCAAIWLKKKNDDKEWLLDR